MKVRLNYVRGRVFLNNYCVCVPKIPDKDRFETMILYPDKAIENMEKNHVTGSLYLAAVKRVVLNLNFFSIVFIDLRFIFIPGINDFRRKSFDTNG